MMKRVAAGPIDQPDVGIGQLPAVVVERLARLQQHVGNPRHRDEVADAVAANRHIGQRHRQGRLAGVRGRSQCVGETAAGQADLAEHRRQHHAHPHRLLAMLGALQGLRAGDQRAPSDRAPRQSGDLVRRHATDIRGPAGILRPAILTAEEIGLERLPADAIAVEKAAVVAAFGHQRVGDPEHQRDVGSRADRVPHRVRFRRQVVAQRADQVEFDAAPARRAQIAAGDMATGSATADIVVFERHPAKGQHQGAFRDQFGPADIVAGDDPLRPDDVRQDHRRGTRTVAVDRTDITAGEVQKAVDLVLRIVKETGAGPAIGATEHAARPMLRVNPPQFRGGEIERLRPRHRHKRVAAALPVRPRPMLEPAAPRHRPGDARAVRHRSRDVGEQR